MMKISANSYITVHKNKYSFLHKHDLIKNHILLQEKWLTDFDLNCNAINSCIELITKGNLDKLKELFNDLSDMQKFGLLNFDPDFRRQKKLMQLAQKNSQHIISNYLCEQENLYHQKIGRYGLTIDVVENFAKYLKSGLSSQLKALFISLNAPQKYGLLNLHFIFDLNRAILIKNEPFCIEGNALEIANRFKRPKIFDFLTLQKKSLDEINMAYIQSWVTKLLPSMPKPIASSISFFIPESCIFNMARTCKEFHEPSKKEAQNKERSFC